MVLKIDTYDPAAIVMKKGWHEFNPTETHALAYQLLEAAEVNNKSVLETPRWRFSDRFYIGWIDKKGLHVAYFDKGDSDASND